MTDADYLAWLADPNHIPVVLVEVIARIGSTETTLYLSNRAHATLASDTPSGVSYEPCIGGGVTFNESLNFSGQPSISYGDIEIDNSAGLRDAWLSYVWANRRVKVFYGDARWVRSDFRQVLDGVVGDMASRSTGSPNLTILDKLQRLNNAMTEAVLGGASANKDRLLPVCVGECFNVSPLLSDPVTLKHMVNNGTIEDVIEVRSNGAVPVSITKQLTTGEFTLAANPQGAVITASVQGYKPGATFYRDASNLVQIIVTNFGPASTRFTTADLDLVQLAAFASANPQSLGLFADQRANVLDVCQQLVASVGAQVVTSSLGLLRIAKIDLPGVGTPFDITPSHIYANSLAIDSRPPVVAAVTIGYCKNWTVESSLAGGLAPASVPLFTEEWLDKTATDATTATVYSQEVAPVRQETMLQVDTEATAEATRRLNLWKTPRTVYTMQCTSALMLVELGDAVTLTHPLYGLVSTPGVVVSVERDWMNSTVRVGVLA